MAGDIRADEAFGGPVDVPRSVGELLDQSLRDTDDLRMRVHVRAAYVHRPPDTEHPGQPIGEHPVVVRGERSDRRMHRPTVKAAPSAIEDGLHLVGDHHMGMKLRVPARESQ